MKRRLPLLVALALALGGTLYYLFVPSQADIDFHAPKYCEYERLQALAARDGVDDALAARIEEVSTYLTAGMETVRARGSVARALRTLDCSQVESYDAFNERLARQVQAEQEARAAGD